MNARAPTDAHAHRRFLNRYYGISRHFYDLTRKYYLFGRDTALRQILRDDRWRSLVEVGPGTGRNLRKVYKARPGARLGGLEASDEMLAHAAQRCRWAHFRQGFAEEAHLSEVLGEPPDRILFSYCLSMVQQQRAAVENCREGLSPGGKVVIVDFGDFEGMPGAFPVLMRKWLATFHVYPVDISMLEALGATITWGPGRYFFIATVPAAV
jgi:S-adenosylmethionine-diacylgycerolhomoserine-N-methlytransferase